MSLLFIALVTLVSRFFGFLSKSRQLLNIGTKLDYYSPKKVKYWDNINIPVNNSVGNTAKCKEVNKQTLNSSFIKVKGHILFHVMSKKRKRKLLKSEKSHQCNRYSFIYLLILDVDWCKKNVKIIWHILVSNEPHFLCKEGRFYCEVLVGSEPYF